jgi:hypothetical protein
VPKQSPPAIQHAQARNSNARSWAHWRHSDALSEYPLSTDIVEKLDFFASITILEAAGGL